MLTNGDRPCPRKDHAFNIINRKGVAVLTGGTDQYGSFLSDIWLFDLVRLQWRQITTEPRIDRALG